jgi:hypothetical protein
MPYAGYDARQDLAPRIHASYPTCNPVEDAEVWEGSLVEYARLLGEELGLLPTEFSVRYFDAAAFARDLVQGGEVVNLGEAFDSLRSTLEYTGGVWLTNPQDL